MSVTVIKLSKRTMRSTCKRCNVESDYYWGEIAGSNVKVLLDQGPLNEGIEYTGSPVPVSTVHACFRRDAGLDSVETDSVENVENVETEVVEAEAVVEAVETEAVSSGELAALRKLLQQIIGQPQIDANEVKRIAREVVEGVVMPERTYVMKDNVRREIEGVTHKQFGDVLKAIAAGVNVQLVGAPGVGKTHMCEQVAKALGRDFYVIGFHQQSTASELRGFISATGDFVWTVVYDWATNPNGGLLLTDELDRSHPGIQAALNSVLSNRFIVFPNRETVRLTDQHAIIAATNTYGDGPTWEFPAAMKFSAEFKDRFVTLDIEIDEKVELAAALAKGAPRDVTERAVTYVRKVRANVKREAVEGVTISPRASQYLAGLLAQDVEWDKAIQWTLRKGMDADTWSKVA